MKRRLRVGIDGFALGLAKGTGVTTYSRNLSYALRDLGVGIDVLYGRPNAAHGSAAIREIEFFDTAPKQKGISERVLRALTWPARILRSALPLAARSEEVPIGEIVERGPIQAQLPEFDRILNSPALFERAHRHFRYTGRMLQVRVSDPPDVFHWTYPLPAHVVGSKNVYTILDLIPLRMPYSTLDYKRFYLRLVQTIGKHADLIVTISEFSRRDIEKIIAPACPVINTFMSSRLPEDICELPVEELAKRLLSAFGVEYREYYLYVGAVEPRKNLKRLLEAFLSIGSKRQLVIAGPDGWLYEDELSLADQRHLKAKGLRTTDGKSVDRILRLQYMTFRQLVLLIRGARAVVLPSLYEGFGLPVLEAMMVGTPVIASSTTSLAELGGDVVTRVDPLNVESIVEAFKIHEGWDHEFLPMGERLRAEAARFSHDRFRERLAAAYSRVVPEFGDEVSSGGRSESGPRDEVERLREEIA